MIEMRILSNVLSQSAISNKQINDTSRGGHWKMANAFCYWRTKLWSITGEVNSEDFRLPTEHEWEYAARGGHEHAPYPWGGYYVSRTNSEGTGKRVAGRVR